MAHVSVRYPWRENAEWSFKRIGASSTDQLSLIVDFTEESRGLVGTLLTEPQCTTPMVTKGQMSL
jgi:hypothetical protein